MSTVYCILSTEELVHHNEVKQAGWRSRQEELTDNHTEAVGEQEDEAEQEDTQQVPHLLSPQLLGEGGLLDEDTDDGDDDVEEDGSEGPEEGGQEDGHDDTGKAEASVGVGGDGAGYVRHPAQHLLRQQAVDQADKPDSSQHCLHMGRQVKRKLTLNTSTSR